MIWNLPHVRDWIPKLKSIEWNHSWNWTLNIVRAHVNWMYHRMPNMNSNPLTEMDPMLALLFTAVIKLPCAASFRFLSFFSCFHFYHFSPSNERNINKKKLRDPKKNIHGFVAQIRGYTNKNRCMFSLECDCFKFTRINCAGKFCNFMWKITFFSSISLTSTTWMFYALYDLFDSLSSNILELTAES